MSTTQDNRTISLLIQERTLRAFVFSQRPGMSARLTLTVLEKDIAQKHPEKRITGTDSIKRRRHQQGINELFDAAKNNTFVMT